MSTLPKASNVRRVAAECDCSGIEVGGAALECTIYGSGSPVVLLANAACSSGYFEGLARALAAGGLQAISVNMRGTGDDLAVDLAGSLKLWIAVWRTSLAMPPATASLAVCRSAGPHRCAACLPCGRRSHRNPNTTSAWPFAKCYRSQDERQRLPQRAGDALAVVGAGYENTCAGRMLARSKSRMSRPAGGMALVPILVIQGLDDDIASPGNDHALREQFRDRRFVIR